jgi:RNA polymerase sigma factor (sigma-70 family)
MATAPPTPDAVLATRLRQRDRTAWEELYAEYGPRLRAFAYRLTGNPHDADDLVQETFVRALPRLDRLDPETVQLGPYLFTTLRNTFLKRVEREQRLRPVEDVPEPDEPQPIEDDPERQTLLTSQQEEVRLANAKLAPRQRLVLALRELEDKSYAEIGVIVGLNENAVAQLISRARESLRIELRLAQVDPERIPEECRGYLPLLSRHLDGQLREPRLGETLAHVETCAYCQDALDSMREAGRRYRALPFLFGDDDAHAARIDAELTSAGFWAGPRRRVPLAALFAAAVLLALGLAGAGSALLLADDERVAATTTGRRTTSATASTGQTTTAPVVQPTTRPQPTRPTTTTAPPRTTKPATTSGKTTTKTTSPTTTTAPVAPPPSTAPTTTAPPTTTAVTTTTGPAKDTTAPTVTFTARPASPTSLTGATFGFRASEAGVTFACRLDGGAWTACTTPRSYEALPIGTHAFAVRATDRAGNVGPAASVDWRIVPPPDTTAPATTITGAQISDGSASFTFAANEADVTFACTLDGAAATACSSPAAYAGLAPGNHVFSVRATDAAGNTGAPAEHAWTIATPLPDLVISKLTETSFTATNTGPAAAGPFVVTVTLIGTFTIPGLAPGASATRVWSACRIGTLLATADRGAAVAESNESNNTATLVSDC